MKKFLIILGFILGILGILIGTNFLTKFKNAQIEFGTEKIDKKEFINYGMDKYVEVDLSKINYQKIGRYPVAIKYFGIKYEKSLDIVDTTAPELETEDIYKKVNYEIDVKDFVVQVTDLDEVSLSYEGNIDTSLYGRYPIKIIAQDKSGNKVIKENTLLISWTKLDYEIEMGNTLKREDLVFDKKDINTISQEEIDVINNGKEGSYTVKSVKDNVELTINVLKTEDKTPPTLVLKNVTIYDGKKVSGVNAFVTKATDKCSKVSLKLLTNINYSKIGEQKVEIEASDENGNKVVKSATLKIIKDTKGPVFKGLSKITINKNAKIDYRKGVSAYDDNYGNSEFSYDASKVDVSKYGTYYATYTSKDKIGNKTTAKRVIMVNHDKSDTNALVLSVASGLSGNAESIRDYVRTKIKYSTNSGGSDPVWQGLHNKVGNCIVHAYTFDALLKAKGFNTKIIYTKDKTHYWNLVYLNGSWRHMDSTPGSRHTKYSIMTDDMRYETLQGRDWDRSKWPKAE